LFAVQAPEALGNVLKDAASGVDAVAIVAGKDLVATVAGQSNSHVLAGETGNVIGRQHGGVPEGFLERTGEGFDSLEDVGFEDEFMMLGFKTLGNYTGVVRLVEVIMLEADRKSLYRPGTGARH